MSNTIAFQLKNNLNELEKLTRLVDEFGEKNRLAPDDLYALHLSLDEVLTNIISYGYSDVNEHLIAICIALKDKELIAEVEDDGNPFDPSEVPEPDLEQPLEKRAIGGLGIHLVRKMIDALEYRRKDGKNLLTMKRKVKNL